MDTCIANPGTTELAFVRAFDDVPGWRVVPALFEGVCSGAADGYARIAGRPALTLTHLGPGFANSIANLHNARRAHTPIVNVIGDQTTTHLPFDAPLTSDIASLARPVSAWVHYLGDASEAAETGTEAVARAAANGGQIATVVFAADAQAAPAAMPAMPSLAPLQAGSAAEAPARAPADPAAVREAARRLRAGNALLLIGGEALSEAGLQAAQRIVAATGAAFYCETFPAVMQRGHRLPAPERFPYFPEPAFALAERMQHVVVSGAPVPITYFGWPGFPSRIVGDDKLLMLADPTQAATAALQALAEVLECPPFHFAAPRMARAGDAGSGGAWDGASAARTVAAWLPEGAIVSVEGGTCGYPFYAASASAARHTTLTNTGGAIGQGLPVALGAAVACPGRPVVALVSDGSTQYTVQALWTIAHEALPVVVLVAANHQYAILRNELRRGNAALGERAAVLTSLDSPRIDWVALATAYGVSGTRAATVADLERMLQQALASGRPALIEMAL
jgi:acetolactate synthase-1/2/3 large subunit